MHSSCLVNASASAYYVCDPGMACCLSSCFSLMYSSYNPWTNPYIRAVISCLSRHKASNMAKIQESQLRQALEYFNLPESIWPTGLHVRHTHGKACDKLADDLTITIKDEFTRMAQQDRCDEATISRGIVAVRLCAYMLAACACMRMLLSTVTTHATC